MLVAIVLLLINDVRQIEDGRQGVHVDVKFCKQEVICFSINLLVAFFWTLSRLANCPVPFVFIA